MEKQNQENKSQAVFVKPFKVKRSSSGQLLIYLNSTTIISLHPNYINKILENSEGQ